MQSTCPFGAGFNSVTVHRGRLDGVGASLLANSTGSRKIPMLGTVRTIREQARSYKHNRGPVNSYNKIITVKAKSMGLLSGFDRGFADFLRSVAAATSSRGLVARNFLLDEGILMEWAQSYVCILFASVSAQGARITPPIPMRICCDEFQCRACFRGRPHPWLAPPLSGRLL
jgi:hypothetical protein